MADEEHLRVLREGVEAWNRWRKEHPRVWPDLREADLGGAKLSGVDLWLARLSGANLSRANLSRTNLRQTDLRGASLYEARLTQANLTWVDLREADIRRANLHGMSFTGNILIEGQIRATDFWEAKLAGADFSEARAGWTVFGDVDLSCVKGLESMVHDAPSTIGVDTVYRSRGQIPEVFLRGCGVPDEFITYMRSLVGRPIEYYSCFISYSSKDQAFAERLHADLQARGVRCWFAPEDMKIGDRFRQRIDEAIRWHDKLLLILSEHSVESDWVTTEVEAAFEKERQRGKTVLFPVRIDDPVMTTDQAWAADIRRTRHIGDFTCWKDHDAYTAAFDRLLSDLKAAKP